MEAAPFSLSPCRADTFEAGQSVQGQRVGCLCFQKTELLLCDRQHDECFPDIQHLI